MEKLKHISDIQSVFNITVRDLPLVIQMQRLGRTKRKRLNRISKLKRILNNERFMA